MVRRPVVESRAGRVKISATGGARLSNCVSGA